MFARTPNTFKAALDERRVIFGLHLSMPCPNIVEVGGAVPGIDFIHIDGEHGLFDLKDLENCVRAADLMGKPVFARVPDSSTETIERYLDRGVRGIVAPHVSTLETARRVADACRFAPLGTRSFGSSRGELYGFYGDKAAYVAAENADRVVCGLIEDVEGMNNLEAMLKVAGIDCWSVGPSDLSLSMGFTDGPNHPEVKQAIAAIHAKVEAAGKPIRSKYLKAIRDRNLIHDGLARAVAGK